MDLRENFMICFVTLHKKLIGALSSRPYPFTLRPWEHVFKMTLDFTNSFAQYLIVGVAYDKVRRSLPTFINEYNEETPWINDKTRFAFEGAYVITNKTSYKKHKQKVLFLQDILFLMYYYDQMSSQLCFRLPNIFFVFGNTISLELLSVLVVTLQKYTFLKLRTIESLPSNTDLEANYQINDSIKDFQNLTKSDLCLLIETNTRYESSYLNLKLRKRYLKKDFKIASFSSFLNITLPIYFLGSVSKTLKIFSAGNHLESQDFMLSNNPVVILNSEFFRRKDCNIIFNLIETLKSFTFFTFKNWNGLNILNNSLNDVGVSSINKFPKMTLEDLIQFKAFFFIDIPFYSLYINKLIELKALNFFFDKSNINQNVLKQKLSKSFNSFRRNHMFSLSLLSYGSSFSYNIMSKFKKTFKINIYKHFAAKNFFETSGCFQNAEGFLKKSLNVISSKKTVQEHWKFLRLISKNIKNFLFFTGDFKNNMFISYNVKTNAFWFKNYISLHFFATRELNDLSFFYLSENSTFFLMLNKFFLTIQKNFNTKFKFCIDDFYQGGRDLYSTHSKTMVLCSKLLRKKNTTFAFF